MASWPSKDPDAVLDYTYDIPLDTGDTVSAYTFAKLSGDVVIDQESRTGAQVTAWLSGGTDGETAVFQVSWETAGGRADDEVITLSVAAHPTLPVAGGYTNTSAGSLKTAFPRFADVPDGTVEFWLTRARRSVDTSWTEDDYAMGQMLLAAHFLTLNGLGTGAEAGAAANGTGDYKTIRSGSVTLERFDRAAGGAQGELTSTSYGRQFSALARLNVGGPRVMATGTVSYDGLRYPQGEE